MNPLNDEELVLVRGMIAQHQADKARAADQRTDDNLEILALRDELALVKSEAAQLEAHLAGALTTITELEKQLKDYRVEKHQ